MKDAKKKLHSTQRQHVAIIQKSNYEKIMKPQEGDQQTFTALKLIKGKMDRHKHHVLKFVRNYLLLHTIFVMDGLIIFTNWLLIMIKLFTTTKLNLTAYF